jgi:hypothetical protein
MALGFRCNGGESHSLHILECYPNLNTSFVDMWPILEHNVYGSLKILVRVM